MQRHTVFGIVGSGFLVLGLLLVLHNPREFGFFTWLTGIALVYGGFGMLVSSLLIRVR